MEATAIQRLFEEIKGFTFWNRLFKWRAFRAISFEALQEYTHINDKLKEVTSKLEAASNDIDLLKVKRDHAQEQLESVRENLVRSEGRVEHLQQEVTRLESDKTDLDREIQFFKHTESNRIGEHDTRMAHAIAMKESFEKRLRELEDSKVRGAEEFHAQQRETWRNHEESVKTQLRTMCDRIGIEYVQDVPVKGNPDNAIRICDEIIIFDAKSPGSDDLSNFNTYLRTQAESVAKYLTDESIRKEIYLVIPSNTVTVVKKFIYNMGRHNVFVVTLDSLEALLVHLRKLEEYEFAEQLSPDDRQSICRVIGSLIHASKRRIQIDQFLNSDLLELIAQVQSQLPDALQEEINENERARKLNPPADKRSKDIQVQELSKRQVLLRGMSSLHNIPMIKMIDVEEFVPLSE